jgi:hypothetical protein
VSSQNEVAKEIPTDHHSSIILPEPKYQKYKMSSFSGKRFVIRNRNSNPVDLNWKNGEFRSILGEERAKAR